ncbi:hypothetical protein JOF28_001158 [Leucobacter exalbidus]|uniref:DUF4190 domain-containing protein n=1 Tax=Leucobacter exalbidus TaxID=662960 RepID=A0A940PVE9_9MICO|nr:DUF4190 domain-containing protein [Leucobacter exalbidus]MBP1325926.1 hypothetical protein [Leucobacter exalbidus]
MSSTHVFQQTSPVTAQDAHGSPTPLAAVSPADKQAETARGLAITSFVLGLASVVSGWTFVVPVLGLVLGLVSLRRKTTERTLALWGVWLNIAMLAFSVGIIIILALTLSAAAVGIQFFGMPLIP